VPDEAVTAFECLCRRHIGPTWDLAYAITGRRADSAEAAAEAFVRVLTPGRPARFDTPSELETALLKATRAIAIDTTRQIRPETASELAREADAEPAQRSPVFAAAYRSLPERWRTALWLTEVLRARVDDAAAILGVSDKGLSQLSSRARSALQDRHLAGDHLEERVADLDDLGAMLAELAIPVPPTLVAMATSRWKAAANSASVVSRSRMGLLSFPPSGRKPLAGAALAVAGLGIIGAAVVSGPLLDHGRGTSGVPPAVAVPSEINQVGALGLPGQNPALAQAAPPSASTPSTTAAASPTTHAAAPTAAAPAASTAPSGGGPSGPLPSPTTTVPAPVQPVASGVGGLLPPVGLPQAPISTTLPTLP
jgi:RNA polymerase sigma factor (sigma-70 family)